MKHSFPKLKIDCDGLSKKAISELADRLRLHFFDIDILGDTIYASKPVNYFRYEMAWKILDDFGVKVT